MALQKDEVFSVSDCLQCLIQRRPHAIGLDKESTELGVSSEIQWWWADLETQCCHRSVFLRQSTSQCLTVSALPQTLVCNVFGTFPGNYSQLNSSWSPQFIDRQWRRTITGLNVMNWIVFLVLESFKIINSRIVFKTSFSLYNKTDIGLCGK